MCMGKEDKMDRQVLDRVLGGLNDGTKGMSILDFTRLIQRTEGNFDCFGKAVSGVCDQESCLWRETCVFESVGRRDLS